MGIIATDLSDAMAADESIRIAAQRKNVVAIGWDPMEDKDMLEFSLGIKVDDDRNHIIHAIGSLVANVLRQMAKGNSGKEIRLTAQLMEVIAENQAQMFTQDAMMNSTTS